MQNLKSKIKNDASGVTPAKAGIQFTGLRIERYFNFYILHFKFHDFLYTKNRGFTLLETVVALAVILGALVGPVSLIIRGINNFSFAKNKLIAINLAQEGIELVRVIRENNQICIEKNTGTLQTWQTDYNGITGSTLLGTQRTIDAIAVTQYLCGSGVLISNPTLTVPSAGCANKLRFDPATGRYGYVSGQPTLFSRCLNISRPFSAESGPPGSAAIPTADIMDVTATISWNERGINRTLTLTERLYNWR
ncbi:MAG: type II secretion system protein [Candidatus Sungbacteria bacterium]|nr:type II secretion system protein [Candidatus Sungbacteria bacterium]